MKKLILICALISVIIASYAQNPVTPYSAASSRPSQSGEGIDKALDGNTATMYHSAYGLNAIPDTVDFYFYGAKSINEIQYTPRTGGGNGVWLNVEIYHATVDNPTNFILGHTLNWANNGNVKTVTYATAIQKPAVIRFVVKSAVGNFSSCAEMKFFSSETGTLTNTECTLSGSSLAAYKDVKITPNSASANTSASGQNINRTYDNNYTTIYHSQHTPQFVVSATNPAVLTYTFNTATNMDYMMYHPRRDGGINGNFGEIEVQYRKTGDAAGAFTTVVASYNAWFSSSASVINFPSSLTNVIQIRINVKSGTGNFASCSEMEFFRKGNSLDNSITGGVFADNLYSGLNPGTTQAQINAISSDFFKAMANCMFNNTYNYKFRVQQYEPYKPVGNLAAVLKTSTYNSFENPTGIYFEANTTAVIFVGTEAAGKPIVLQVSNMTVHNSYSRSFYNLKPGINVVTITNAGLGYIDYYTDDASAQPVTVHIASGSINGCFDSSKHNSADWVAMINEATYAQIDIKGKYINLLLDRNLLRKYNPLDVKPLINVYDSIAKIQFNMMGYSKHNILPKNNLFAYGHNTGGLYAAELGMHFDYSWGEPKYVSVNGILTGDMWGVAHEIGHVNQLRPSMRWAGMTEVSNNIFSTYTEFTLGVTKGVNGRLEIENANPAAPGSSEDVGDASTRLVGGRFKGFLDRTIVGGANHMNNNYFGRAVPFWQLQLYYQFAGALKGAPTLEQRMSGAAPAPAAGVADYAYFLGDVMQAQRNRNDASASHETLMLNFVKDVCNATKEDLTDYFIKVGMLKAIDTTFDDYGSKNYRITQAAIDAAVLSIKANNYPAPISPVLHYLSANSLNAFKNQLVATGTYNVGTSLSGTLLTINHTQWKNVVAFETYTTDNKLLEANIAGVRNAANTSSIINYPTNADWVWAVSFDGTKKLVYSRSTVLPVTLTSFDAKFVASGAELKWTTSSEKDNKLFEIYRSTDGVTFTKIAQILGSGTKETPSNYRYLDRDFQNKAYYKLAQVDFDGQSTVFDEQVKYLKGLDQQVVVYPNPVTAKLYINNLATVGQNASTAKLINIIGKEVRKINLGSGSSSEIDMSDLPKGIYTLQLIGQGKVETRKIVKQ
ncbi:MAG: M60 family metallopeptidase [Pedobacter sp.]|uniref:M60 family metallopeptidase n=1 Tax=Pedobacter sp. TaxID=1411316 RepID=UPI002807DFE3|nr:M60 family metallopeptidase [Pedobacter sp.]MDQ8005607.1 M60 family metallopeptidase [Pedobacter sp.]